MVGDLSHERSGYKAKHGVARLARRPRPWLGQMIPRYGSAMSMVSRLGLYYAAIFVGTGAAGPYMPLWFAAHGMSGAEIGIILSAPMLARVVTAPAIAIWADGFRLRRTPLMLMGAAVALAYALLAAPFGFWWQLGVWFCAASIFSSLSPLMDVMALTRARTEGFNYGWPRGVGSAAYIVANVVVGGLLTRYASDLVLYWLIAAALIAAVGAQALLPDDPVRHGAAPGLAERFKGVSELLRDPLFMTAVGSAGLIQSAHAFYYAFSALVWRGQGISEAVTGWLWGLGVAVEILFLWFMEPWRRSIGPRRLLVLAGAAAVVRWTALAFDPPFWALFPLQALHALTFAATFLAALQLTERLSTPSNATAAQAINSALSGGMLAGMATIASGWLFDQAGSAGYLVMSAMCLAGLAGAVRLSFAKRLDL
jgi:PPP family 3-phenylpropionic acid transporter